MLNTAAYSRSSSSFSGSHLCYSFHHLLYSWKQTCQRCVHSWFSALLYFLLYTRQEQVISSFKLSTWANSRWIFSFFLSQEGWHCSLLCLGSYLCLESSRATVISGLLSSTHRLSFSRWDPHIGLPGWILLSWCPQTMALSCALRSWGRKYSKSMFGVTYWFAIPRTFYLCALHTSNNNDKSWYLQNSHDIPGRKAGWVRTPMTLQPLLEKHHYLWFHILQLP